MPELPPMRVAVLHNLVPPDAPAAEQDVLVQADAVARALRELGCEPTAVPLSLDLRRVFQDLDVLRPDVEHDRSHGTPFHSLPSVPHPARLVAKRPLNVVDPLRLQRFRAGEADKAPFRPNTVRAQENDL